MLACLWMLLCCASSLQVESRHQHSQEAKNRKEQVERERDLFREMQRLEMEDRFQRVRRS